MRYGLTAGRAIGTTAIVMGIAGLAGLGLVGFLVYTWIKK